MDCNEGERPGTGAGMMAEILGHRMRKDGAQMEGQRYEEKGERMAGQWWNIQYQCSIISV